ncbi:MAG: PRC-barrel domain-containing protein [Thermoplasmatales archaeon]|nr:PRC-barrel domain-containing protein [Thermoplasmatales archaeon]
MIAFFSESKAVTIYVNRYGEHHADIIALILIWIICLVGLVSLYFVVKQGKLMKNLESSDIRGRKVMNKEGAYLGILKSSLIDRETGMPFSILVEPSEDIDPRLYTLDDTGHLVFLSESIKSVKDYIIIEK